MKKTFTIIAILAVAATACNKAEIDPSNGELTPTDNLITETVSATSDYNTKAEIGSEDGVFTWSAGDKIAVHVSDGNYYTTSGLESGGSTSATFSVDYTSGFSRDAFAIYPSTIVVAAAENYGQDEHTLDLTLPNTYTLAQVSNDVTPCPMIATNAPGSDWEFKQLCGLLRLTVGDIPANTKRLVVSFGGKKVCGDFSITAPDPGNSVISTSDDASHDYITITNGGEDFSTSAVLNIPLPVGVYTKVAVVAFNHLSNGAALLAGTAGFSYTANRKRATKKNIALNIPHLFSVSSSKCVIIASSNLQATTEDKGASWNWHFATNPWDYNGASNYSNQRISGDGTTSTNGTVDLFGWVGASNTTWEGALGTTLNAAMYGISNSKTLNSTDTYGNVASESLKSDWGNTINDGYTWRTLTITEWLHLLGNNTHDYRTSGCTVKSATINTSSGDITGTVYNARYTLATINSVHGLIIFPDALTLDGSEAPLRYINDRIPSSFGETSWNNGTQCTTEQWATLAAKGCVFLPAPGERDGQNVYYPNDAGYYWSSSPNGVNQALFMRFGKTFGTDITPTNQERWYGLPVRLVRVIN